MTDLVAGKKYLVGKEYFLRQVCAQNRLEQVCTLVSTVPTSFVMLDGRGATNMFEVSFEDQTIPEMRNQVPGTCLIPIPDEFFELPSEELKNSLWALFFSKENYRAHRLGGSGGDFPPTYEKRTIEEMDAAKVLADQKELDIVIDRMLPVI